MKLRSLSIAMASVFTMIGLTACGGGGGGGDSAGGTVVGSIAGFGSIIMDNGNEYSTDDISSCEVDDDVAPGTCEDSLAVGMHVSLQVDGNGSVISLEYDDDLEGPAANVGGTAGNFSFTIFGADVETAAPGTRWEGFDSSPPTLAELDGANIEVSGEWQGGVLHATYVEMQGDGDSTHEAKGTVGEVDGTDFVLILQDGTPIDVDASMANLVPQTGDYVEVEGAYDGAIFSAERIELEDDDDFDEDGEAEITGTLVEDPGSSTGYSIGSTDVDISHAPTCEGLAGSVVEAEGSYDQFTGVLLVEECEDEDDELEMKCQVSNVTVDDPARPKAGSLECAFPATTGGPLSIEFRDSPELATFSDDDWAEAFDLTSVNSGDCVEIDAGIDPSSGAVVAGVLELESSGEGCEEYELSGPVDDFQNGVSITVLGITFTVDGMTAYPDGLPVQGDSVELRDNNADGIADSVEIDSEEDS